MICTGETLSAQPEEYANEFLQTPLHRLDQCGAYEEKMNEIIGKIEELNKILMQANAYVGYQVRNDIVLYLLNNYRTGVQEESAALDHQITQKVLVRAQGNAKTVVPVLEQMRAYCADRYPNAEKKIAQMLEKCRTEDYTAYWV